MSPSNVPSFDLTLGAVSFRGPDPGLAAPGSGVLDVLDAQGLFSRALQPTLD